MFTDYSLRWVMDRFFYTSATFCKLFILLILLYYSGDYPLDIFCNISSKVKATCYPTILSSFFNANIAFLILLDKSFFVIILLNELFTDTFLSIIVLKALAFIFVGSLYLTLIWANAFAVTLVTFYEWG